MSDPEHISTILPSVFERIAEVWEKRKVSQEFDYSDRPCYCDLCGKQFGFSVGVVYPVGGVPKFLCPECAKKEESKDG